MTPEEKAARRLLHLEDLSPPVDVMELARRRYAEVEFAELPVSGDAIVIRRFDNHHRSRIILNKSRKKPARRRFTIAHEIGHLCLWHSGISACYINEYNDFGSGCYWIAEAEANRFASELLMPTAWVQEHIASCDGMESLFEGLKEKADMSYEAARIKLLANLPSGFVSMVEGEPGGRPRVDNSAETPLKHYLDYKDRLDASSVISSLDRLAIDRYTVKRHQRSIHWWRIDCRCELPLIESGRPSTAILKDLLEEVSRNQTVVSKRQQRVNGIIGVMNCNMRERDEQVIYGSLKLRFRRSDVVSDDGLACVVRHPSFVRFLAAKAKELSSGKNVSRRRKGNTGQPLV